MHRSTTLPGPARRNRRRLVGILLTVTALLSACGGNDADATDDASATIDTTATTDAPASTTPDAEEPEQPTPTAPPEPTTPPEPTATTAPAPQPVAPDIEQICALIDPADLERVLGVAMRRTPDDRLDCWFTAVGYEQGAGSYSVTSSSAGRAAFDNFDEFVIDNGPPTIYEAIDGPWDDARYFVNSGGAIDLYLVAGTLFIETSIGGTDLTGLQPPADLRPQLTELATLLLGRIDALG